MPVAESLVTPASVKAGELPLAGGVLLSTLGGPGSDTAARSARLFADRCGTPIEVLTVLEPLPPDLVAYAPSFVNVDDERRASLADTVRDQMHRTGVGNSVPVVVEEGPAAERIAGRAKVRGAALIAMGIGRHDATDRLLGVEPAIAVLHRTSVPVLAASPNGQIPARTVVIATDFSAASERAARLALTLAAEDATVHIVHAWPWIELGGSGTPSWFQVYEAGVTSLVDALVRSLPVPSSTRVVTHLQHGEAAEVVGKIAATQRADLIAMGSHGRGFFDRLTLGSVAETVLRKAQCSVLIAPPTPDEKE